jgi:predicted nuclease of predicted toxin-antitoxin system
VRLLIDENLPADLATGSQQQLIDVARVRDVMQGAKDAAILARLRATGEVLVTRDVRFANLVLDLMASGTDIEGVVLIREQSLDKIRVAWQRFLATPRPKGGITVVTATHTRFRRVARSGRAPASR